ncbi:MAG: carbohydrate kinase family protein, partial [Parasporobacterium sp.]|nr:carbohydrate kinase family protein [Parasporobacterium sp.]
MTEKKYDVLTSGYVSMDQMVKIQTPARVGYTSIITNKTNMQINYGGCGTNIACNMSRLGM